jgi:hypothetical protein
LVISSSGLSGANSGADFCLSLALANRIGSAGSKAAISFASIKRLYQHPSASPKDDEGDGNEQMVRWLDPFESRLR